MKRIDRIQEQVKNTVNSKSSTAADYRCIFDSAEDLKKHLQNEHGLSLIDFNKLVGFTLEYIDYMENGNSTYKSLNDLFE